MKKVLIICYSDHSKEPRLLMAYRALKNQFTITTAGFAPLADPNIQFIRLSGKKMKAWFSFHLNLPALLRLPFSALNKLQAWLTGFPAGFPMEDYKLLKGLKYDLIICHHPSSLDLAFKLKEKYRCKIIFNAHEIYPYEFEESKEWMQKNFEPNHQLLKKYLPLCDMVFTVNQEICDFYTQNYSCKCEPIHNSRPYAALQPGYASSPLRIIHHGGAMPRRKLEQMADAVIALNGKFELSFMLVKNTEGNYLESLKEKYESKGIKFVDPVAYSNIVDAINAFDIGLYILPNSNINQELALPNKFFEFIQARLAVITSPNRAMKNLIEKHGVGLVADGFETDDMIRLLDSISKESISSFKRKSDAAAKELSSENDEKRILATVNKVLS